MESYRGFGEDPTIFDKYKTEELIDAFLGETPEKQKKKADKHSQPINPMG